jgi:1-acyl-sn-glycerol-3-phosphate acyltransferase
MLSQYFYKVLRRLFFNAHLRGVENLRSGEPAILVANHAGAFGPVSVITSMPVEMHPWVAHEVTDLRSVASRIQAEFCEQELRLRPPLSAYLARLIGRVCVAIMKDIGAIPVYQKSKDIRATVAKSLSLLEQGKSILVFAEDSTRRINEVLCEFCTGFIHVAKLYYQTTKKAVLFFPVAVNRNVHRIRVGSPIRFDATIPFGREKQRIKDELERSVYSLYRQLEEAPSLSPQTGP